MTALSYRALYVWSRNFTVWQRYWYTTFVGSLGAPALYFVAIGYGLGSFIREVEGMPYVAFLAPALVVTSIMQAASFETTYSSYTRMEVQRTYMAIAVTPVSLQEVIAGEILWAATKAMVPGVIMFAVTIALGFAESWTVVWVLPLMPLVGFLFATIGMLMTSFARDYDFFTYFFTLFIEPMFLFSGTFFPLSAMPVVIQKAAWVLPLTHPVYLCRAFYRGVTPEGLWLHVGWLLLLSTVLFVWTIRRMVNRLVD